MSSFSDILEQTSAKAEFSNSFRQNRLNHAYLLAGSYGIGKVHLARAVAARYLCNSPVDNDACGECRSCTLLQHGNHPDYLELPRDTADLKIGLFTPRSGSSGESSQQQTVLSFMRLKPMNGKGRVCIIPDCERINIEAANAFLKTLEEPPPASLIILTTSNKNRLLPTITSRCRIVGMSRLSNESIKNYLIKQKDLQPADAEELSLLAEGSLGRALDFTESDTLDNWRQNMHHLQLPDTSGSGKVCQRTQSESKKQQGFCSQTDSSIATVGSSRTLCAPEAAHRSFTGQRIPSPAVPLGCRRYPQRQRSPGISNIKCSYQYDSRHI